MKKNTPPSVIVKIDHYAAYIIFTLSVSGYFYLSKNQGLELLNQGEGDPLINYMLIGLTVCWLGSVLVMAQRLRFYLQYAPGWRSYVTALSPLLVVPAIWLVVQAFNYVEV